MKYKKQIQLIAAIVTLIVIPGDRILPHGSLHTQSIRGGKTMGAVFQYFAL